MKFNKSSNKNKKYCCEYFDGDELKKVHFGNIRRDQYKDNTSLNLYEAKNHLDPDRRLKKRKQLRPKAREKYSPQWFEYWFLE
jgi:hypothetical protein